MVDQVETQDSPVETPGDPVVADQELLSSARNPDAVSNALAHEREKNKEMAARLAEYADRDKSEQQKLAERADNAEQKYLEAERRALVYEVAVEKGLVGERAALASRLTGTTKEELLADADQLIKFFPVEQPTTSFDGGARGVPAQQGDMDSRIRQVARRG